MREWNVCSLCKDIFAEGRFWSLSESINSPWFSSLGTENVLRRICWKIGFQGTKTFPAGVMCEYTVLLTLNFFPIYFTLSETSAAHYVGFSNWLQLQWQLLRIVRTWDHRSSLFIFFILPKWWICGFRSEGAVASQFTYSWGEISETTLMELPSEMLNSWNKTHSGILLVL